MKALEEYQGPRDGIQTGEEGPLLSGSEAYRAGNFLETPLLKLLDETITAYTSISVSVYSSTIRRGEGWERGRAGREGHLDSLPSGGGKGGGGDCGSVDGNGQIPTNQQDSQVQGSAKAMARVRNTMVLLKQYHGARQSSLGK